ncbi:MAG: glycoside hydrolase family 88 protein [Acidobacteriota bacterium]|nr:glycoside hydrolase family 88 protein [Acidobacteriota bacterium]
MKRLSLVRSNARAVLHGVAAVVAACMVLAWQASAQEQHIKPAPPGDSLDVPGPLARDLSPKLDRRHLARAITLVADWQLARLPAETQYDWTFAALYAGYMAVPDGAGGARYRKAMYDVGEALHWSPGPRVEHADDLAVGQMYLEQYALQHDRKMLDPIRARLDAEIAAGDGRDRPLWWWCDALFMAPPVFADVARATGDARYLDFMDRQWEISSKLLYDHTKHLYARDASFLDKREKNGEKIFWSRGNGWVMGGIVRVLQALPADSPLRPKYVALLQAMAAEVIEVQGKDGLWRPGLLDPAGYPLPEISGSAFITYALAYGVNEKILDRKTYWPVVEHAWAGMLTHVYADGRLGCIQPVGAAPGAFSETSSYVYGVGAYLMAGAEIYRTAK